MYYIWLKKITAVLGTATDLIAKILEENSLKFYKIINGKTKPSYDTIFRLIEKYPEKSPEYIFTGIEPIIINSKKDGALVDDISYEEIPCLPIEF